VVKSTICEASQKWLKRTSQDYRTQSYEYLRFGIFSQYILYDFYDSTYIDSGKKWDILELNYKGSIPLRSVLQKFLHVLKSLQMWKLEMILQIFR
jgi:hypothetical protein